MFCESSIILYIVRPYNRNFKNITVCFISENILEKIVNNQLKESLKDHKNSM